MFLLPPSLSLVFSLTILATRLPSLFLFLCLPLSISVNLSLAIYLGHDAMPSLSLPCSPSLSILVAWLSSPSLCSLVMTSWPRISLSGLLLYLLPAILFCSFFSAPFRFLTCSLSFFFLSAYLFRLSLQLFCPLSLSATTPFVSTSLSLSFLFLSLSFILLSLSPLSVCCLWEGLRAWRRVQESLRGRPSQKAYRSGFKIHFDRCLSLQPCMVNWEATSDLQLERELDLMISMI